MDFRTRLVLIVFGCVYSLYDIVFRLRYLSLEWTVSGAVIGLVLGFIFSMAAQKTPSLAASLVLPEGDGPLYHLWCVGTVSGGYIAFNLQIGLEALQASPSTPSALLVLYCLASVFFFVVFIAVDNSIKSREKLANYLPAFENTWTPLTLALSLLTAIAAAQIGSVFVLGYVLSVMLILSFIAYAAKTFGPVIVIAVLVISSVAIWAVCTLAKKKRRQAYTRRLLTEMEGISLTS